MRYILELSDMQGDGLGEERLSRFESDSPIPIPMPGDAVAIEGTGEQLVVVKRHFNFNESLDEVVQHVQVFCGTEEQYKKRLAYLARE